MQIVAVSPTMHGVAATGPASVARFPNNSTTLPIHSLEKDIGSTKASERLKSFKLFPLCRKRLKLGGGPLLVRHERSVALILASLLSLSLSLPISLAGPTPEILVAPGKLMMSEGSTCTVAFVLRDATGGLYFVTAGHCLSPKGVVFSAKASLNGLGVTQGPKIGQVLVVQRNASTGDWGLVKILPEIFPRTSGQTLYWTGPTGIAKVAKVERLSTSCFYGGTVAAAVSGMQARCGRYTGQSNLGGPVILSFTGLAAWGDSGSPVLDYASGRALGVIISLGASGSGGPVQATGLDYILERTRSVWGLDLSLVTADYRPPPS